MWRESVEWCVLSRDPVSGKLGLVYVVEPTHVPLLVLITDGDLVRAQLVGAKRFKTNCIYLPIYMRRVATAISSSRVFCSSKKSGLG
jgi:hypothetical protein